MTSERAKAYGRVIRLLDEVVGEVLRPAEADAIREAADTLLFADDAGEAGTELDEASALLAYLVESERIPDEAGRALIADLTACGPLDLVHS